MKLRNNQSGEIKAVNHAKILVHFSDGTTNAFNSIKQLTDMYSDYTEPLIKDEKIRKAVRAWADASGVTKVLNYGDIFWLGFRSVNTASVWKFECFYTDASEFKLDKEYTIAELCGEEEE